MADEGPSQGGWMEAPTLGIPEIDGTIYVEATQFEENGDEGVNGPDLGEGNLTEGEGL